MPYYAQLDEAGIVTAVTETWGEIEAAHMVVIESLDAELLGKRYDTTTGSFVDAVVFPTVPTVISRAQGKAALIHAGLWPAVEAFVAAIADPTERALADVALHDTQTWKRNSTFLTTAGASLGITESQMDSLFVAAAQIEF